MSSPAGTPSSFGGRGERGERYTPPKSFRKLSAEQLGDRHNSLSTVIPT